MTQRDEILDLIRGVSALAVLFAHARGFIFVDFAEVVEGSVLTKAFYFATGVHHQAVMVFFVLSGYFVGGSVIEGFRKQRFLVSRYCLARISRLWVALIPALFLTMVLDAIGRGINPEAYLGGFRDIFMSGPEPNSVSGFSATAFLGNLAFLQTVEVPVFGSNGPLWSLANEFWYYVLFPLLAYACVPFNKCATARFGYIYSPIAVAAFVLLS